MIRVDRSAAMATVQDGGRRGLRHLGVGLAGAADLPSAQIANLMLGNDVNDAVLEVTIGPCHLTFLADTRIALAGADFDATLDDRLIASWWSVPVKAGQKLTLRGGSGAQRCYVAVTGGIAVPLVHGSRATDLNSGFGGYKGRMIRKGDMLPLAKLPSLKKRTGIDSAAFGIRAPFWHAGATEQTSYEMARAASAADGSGDISVRVLPAPEYIRFDEQVQKTFWSTAWALQHDSNRMGLRLAGPLLSMLPDAGLAADHVPGSGPGLQGGVLPSAQPTLFAELASHAVMPGVIQVPPGGKPIILMQDAQTTGGYPRIGVVIRADLPRLAQMTVNQTIHFEPCDTETALEAWRQQQKWIADLARRLEWQNRK